MVTAYLNGNAGKGKEVEFQEANQDLVELVHCFDNWASGELLATMSDTLTFHSRVRSNDPEDSPARSAQRRTSESNANCLPKFEVERPHEED
jgi:hypothetical protein